MDSQLARMTRTRLGRIAVVLAAAGVLTALTGWTDQSSTTAPAPRSLGYVLGGWNLTTPASVRAAAADGLNTDLLYGTPPTPATDLGAELASAHMHVVSAEIADQVSSYECTRTHTVAPPPAGAEPYCAGDSHTDRRHLLAVVGDIIARDSANPLITGYWVLDDTAGWDEGGLRDVLTEIHAMLPANRPAVCGLSASLTSNGNYRWDRRRAANVSTGGCDVVAPYVYALPQQPHEPAPANIDWSMRGLLSDIAQDLARQGWDSARPLLGVAQAWGGRHRGDNAIENPPTPADMRAQAGGYCTAGATGMAWYAWMLSEYPAAQTPANDADLDAGVRGATHGCDGPQRAGAR